MKKQLLRWFGARSAKKANPKPPRWVESEKGLLGACPHCGMLNEMPFLDCEDCGMPRFKPTKWGTSLDLSLVLSAFLYSFMFADVLSWKWPIFILIAILFNQFCISMVRGRYRLHTRIHLWQLIVIGGMFVAFHFSAKEGGDYLVYAAGALPDLFHDYPLIAIPAAVAPVLCLFAVVMVRWSRKYGWMNTIHLVLISLVFISLGLTLIVEGLALIHRQGWYPQSLSDSLTDFVETGKPRYDQYLGLATVRTLQFFIFEIFVVSAVKGFAAVRQRAKREVATNEAGLSRSMLGLTRVVHRVAQTVENMVQHLIMTSAALALNIWDVFKIFCRELLIPFAAMVAAGGLIRLLTSSIEVYIEHNSLHSVLTMIAVVVLLILCALIFLWCKTKMRLKRTLSFYGELVTWLLPNLMIFFLLLSLTLWASSWATNRFEMQVEKLPFRIGLLTKIVFGLVVVMVGIVYSRNRNLFVVKEEAEPEPTAIPKAEPEPAPEPAPAAKGKTLRERVQEKAKPLTDKVAEAKGAVKTNQRFAGFSKKARQFKERLGGKPGAVLEAEELRHEINNRREKLEALERTRESITPETYANLKKAYDLEIEKFESSRGEKMVEIEKMHAENLVELNRLDAEVKQLKVSLADLEKLHEAGALDEATKAEMGPMKQRIEDMELQLGARQRQHEWFEAEINPGE